MSGIDGTGPPATGWRPRRSTAAGRVVACRERRISDCKVGAGQGPRDASEHARAVRGRAVANRRLPVQDRRRSRAQVHMRRRAGRAQPGRARSAVIYPGHLLAHPVKQPLLSHPRSGTPWKTAGQRSQDVRMPCRSARRRRRQRAAGEAMGRTGAATLQGGGKLCAGTAATAQPDEGRKGGASVRMACWRYGTREALIRIFHHARRRPRATGMRSTRAVRGSGATPGRPAGRGLPGGGAQSTRGPRQRRGPPRAVGRRGGRAWQQTPGRTTRPSVRGSRVGRVASGGIEPGALRSCCINLDAHAAPLSAQTAELHVHKK